MCGAEGFLNLNVLLSDATASTIAAEKAAEWRACGDVTRLRSATTGASSTQAGGFRVGLHD